MSVVRYGAVILLGLLVMLTALYPSIMLHEVGHTATAAALGCRDAWSSVSVHLTVVGPSFVGAIDDRCLAPGAPWSTFAVAIAGCLVNFALVAVAWALAGRSSGRPLLATWLYAVAAVNFLEAFSYFVGNAIVPRTDMIPILQTTHIPHLVFAGVAAVAALAMGIPLYRRLDTASGRVAPAGLARVLIAAFSLLIGVGMFVGRLAATG